MVVRRKKKSRYMRGTRTCGWGRTGQHRKSGLRGGVGHAGMHKHMWTWVIKYCPDYFGKHGFTRPPELIPKVNSINVGTLCAEAESLLRRGLAEMKEGKILIDVRKLGYNKVLGGGRVDKPLIVVAPSFSKSAIEKIKASGGEAITVR
ncbi:MAG: 50S ribosomal protein L15 [Thermoprotei archaeon]|nr:MAG: 50S ribosomal protein L15 [Thermoprotei archaeon]RLF24461.1 MAG: 50S ribosomal protein L15 [Thermoprotei archaeon]